MGKANWIIVTLGLAACVALSLMMRQVLAVKQEKATDPVVKGVMEVFGSRLVGRPEFEVESRNDESVGVLTIRPRFRVSVRNTASMMGRFVWHQHGGEGRFRSLEVTALGSEGHPTRTYPIKRPFLGELSNQASGSQRPQASTPSRGR